MSIWQMWNGDPSINLYRVSRLQKWKNKKQFLNLWELTFWQGKWKVRKRSDCCSSYVCSSGQVETEASNVCTGHHHFYPSILLWGNLSDVDRTFGPFWIMRCRSLQRWSIHSMWYFCVATSKINPLIPGDKACPTGNAFLYFFVKSTFWFLI